MEQEQYIVKIPYNHVMSSDMISYMEGIQEIYDYMLSTYNIYRSNGETDITNKVITSCMKYRSFELYTRQIQVSIVVLILESIAMLEEDKALSKDTFSITLHKDTVVCNSIGILFNVYSKHSNKLTNISIPNDHYQVDTNNHTQISMKNSMIYVNIDSSIDESLYLQAELYVDNRDKLHISNVDMNIPNNTTLKLFVIDFGNSNFCNIIDTVNNRAIYINNNVNEDTSLDILYSKHIANLEDIDKKSSSVDQMVKDRVKAEKRVRAQFKRHARILSKYIISEAKNSHVDKIVVSDAGTKDIRLESNQYKISRNSYKDIVKTLCRYMLIEESDTVDGIPVVVMNSSNIANYCSNCGNNLKRIKRKNSLKCSNCKIQIDGELNAVSNLLFRYISEEYDSIDADRQLKKIKEKIPKELYKNNTTVSV